MKPLEVGRVAEVVRAGFRFWTSSDYADKRFVRAADELEKVLVLDCSHSAFVKVLLKEGVAGYIRKNALLGVNHQ